MSEVAAARPERGPRRVVDAVLASALAVALSPVIVVAAGLVRWRLGAPVLFRQERTGVGGRPFTLIKLRTMTDERDAGGTLLPDAQRLVPLGRCLRRLSLDELPELWNVIRGDMALVGPRPLPARYLARYTPTEARRHEVRPGITGWAQVRGRNAASWEERLALDVWYVDHRSLRLDLRILVATLGVVVRGRGVSADGHATMPELRASDTAPSS